VLDFIRAHLADAQAVANNFFGMHAGAPGNIGTYTTFKGAKVSKYSDFKSSAKSFAERFGDLVSGKHKTAYVSRSGQDGFPESRRFPAQAVEKSGQAHAIASPRSPRELSVGQGREGGDFGLRAKGSGGCGALPLINPHPVYEHFLREYGGAVGSPCPASAYGQIEHQEKRLIEGLGKRHVIGRPFIGAVISMRTVQGETEGCRVPDHGIDVEGIG